MTKRNLLTCIWTKYLKVQELIFCLQGHKSFSEECVQYIYTCTRGFKHVLTFLIGLHLFGDEKTNL